MAPEVDVDHAPDVSAQEGATSGGPVVSHACLLLPLLQVAEYCEEAVAEVAHWQVMGAVGGYGGWVGGAGTAGDWAGGGGDGDGGGTFAPTMPAINRTAAGRPMPASTK